MRSGRINGRARYGRTASRRSVTDYSSGEHRTRREDDLRFGKNRGGLAGCGEHASQRARSGGIGWRIDFERGFGIVNQGGKARRWSAADGTGIDVRKNPVASAKN